MGCEEGKIIVHRMGIDVEKFEFSERRKTGTIKILSVGRLVEKKGHEYAIKALAKVVNKNGKDIIYRIVGDGPLKDKLMSLAEELGIEDCVEFMGNVEDEELLKLYKESHIFILPSVTASDGDQEGIPVVLMEAQAMGLPVISTYHSGIPEVVIDGKSGFLVPEKDVDALAEKMEFLVEHPELWSEMGRHGREFVEKHYDIRRLNKRLVEIYQNLIRKENNNDSGRGWGWVSTG